MCATQCVNFFPAAKCSASGLNAVCLCVCVWVCVCFYSGIAYSNSHNVCIMLLFVLQSRLRDGVCVIELLMFLQLRVTMGVWQDTMYLYSLFKGLLCQWL